MKTLIVSDPTLRDGNHAVSHRLSCDQVARYARLADAARIPIVEVGHGNGLGASSLQVGISRESDRSLLEAARSNLKTSLLGVHVIPGFATINRDLRPALELGVDVVRVASHCTEADTTRRHIEFVRNAGRKPFGVLMMSHMAPTAVLVQEARKMESYGAQAVVIMDSAGSYMMSDVAERIRALTEALAIDVGFHGHNNLGLAVASSLAAVQAGATIVDGTIRGFGAGAGNAQLEVLAAVLDRAGYETGIDLYRIWEASDAAAEFLVQDAPAIGSLHIVSGLAGVFSGFEKPVRQAAARYGVDMKDLFFSLGERKVVAGQEDIITEVAIGLRERGTDRPKGPSQTS
jgi:4-hydroxy 2-oxovalerate aldolase